MCCTFDATDETVRTLCAMTRNIVAASKSHYILRTFHTKNDFFPSSSSSICISFSVARTLRLRNCAMDVLDSGVLYLLVVLVHTTIFGKVIYLQFAKFSKRDEQCCVVAESGFPLCSFIRFGTYFEGVLHNSVHLIKFQISAAV